MLLTYDKMQKCRKLPRQAQITQTNSVHDWWKINMRPSKYALNILWSLQIRAKYNENVMNRLSTINSSVCLVKYRRKIQKNKDKWLLNGRRTFRLASVKLTLCQKSVYGRYKWHWIWLNYFVWLTVLDMTFSKYILLTLCDHIVQQYQYVPTTKSTYKLMFH